ncbi:hypothetical protein [Lysinibacillus xylanilyticus]|uniref:hypothetical protein n=1 Tax=Lysinibacillus xylanilyticus TaxID=582475 RepID=UPI003CFCE95D
MIDVLNIDFLYNLRNYAQHAGIPVTRITKSLENEIEIIINKGNFVKSHSGMQSPFKKELNRSQIEEIDINSAIKVVHKELERVHNVFINKIIQSKDNILYSANYINEFYKKHSKYEGELSIISQENADTLVVMSKEPGTATLNPYSVDYKWALMVLEGANTTFKFKGRYVGEGKGFPKILPTQSVVEIPKFYSGSKHVKYKNIMWTKILEKSGCAYKDGFDRLFAVYMPKGLSMQIYKKVIDSFEEEGKKLFDTK